MLSFLFCLALYLNSLNICTPRKYFYVIILVTLKSWLILAAKISFSVNCITKNVSECFWNITTKWLVQSSTERALLIEKQCQVFAVRIIHRGHILPTHNVSKPFESLLWSHKDFPWYPVNKRSDLHLPRFHSYRRFITELSEDMAWASKLEHCISFQADEAFSFYFDVLFWWLFLMFSFSLLAGLETKLNRTFWLVFQVT